MGSANITVYRGVRVTRQPRTNTASDHTATTYTFRAHPRQTMVSAESLDEIHKKMDDVLDAKP
jgi:hypothetical protein